MSQEKSSLNFADRGIVSATSTVELSRRPLRAPDHEGECLALIALMQTMAKTPDHILQELSDTALRVCKAHSAGLSLLEDEDPEQRFHWRAISGEWASHLNGGTPREFGPCGTVLDRNMPLLFSHPERDFPYFANVSPLLEEGLLIPFYIDGKSCGTIWVVLHDADRGFDAEDFRVLTNLATFAGLAYQSVRSVAARANSKRELREAGVAGEFLSAIITSSEDAILSKNLNDIITSWNAGAERLFGYTAEEAIGEPITMVIPQDRGDEESRSLERIRRGEHIEHFETQRQRKNGTLVAISLTISPIKDAAGRVIGASEIARDNTELKAARERQTLLVSEIKHRIKNTLATVQALAMQTLRRTSAEERDAFIARLTSLSHAHDVLTTDNWDRASLSELVCRSLEPFRTARHDSFSIAGAVAWLDASKSLMLTMAVHELATNAAKYGAISNNAGRVKISWGEHLENSKVVIFRWEESGGPPVVAPLRRGFGSRLIESVLKPELGPDLQFLPGGLVCTMAIPVSNAGMAC